MSFDFAMRRRGTCFAASWIETLFLTVLVSVSAVVYAGTGEGPENVPPSPTGGDELPAYEYPYNNGLYATLAGYLGVRDIELKELKTYKLKIESFRKKVPVRAIVQSGTAPLVVVLQGLDGRAESNFGKLWPSIFNKAGYHVLTFDSTFTPAFIEISGHGVTGYLPAEAERIAQIIQSFTQNELKGKVGKIGVVGMSYGGLQALLLGQMATEGKLPFELSAIQAYAPPLDLQYTGETIDKWFDEDRWNYTLAELAGKFSGHKPGDDPTEFSDSMLRAGIAAAFRLGLTDIVVRNDAMYKMNVLPTSGNIYDEQYVRRNYAELWGYSKFMKDMVYPYWSKKLNIGSMNDLVKPLEVKSLLRRQPPYSEVILAADDPFDRPEDIADLKAQASAPVTVLPHGGHLGFVSAPWTKAKLLTLFKSNDRRLTDKKTENGQN